MPTEHTQILAYLRQEIKNNNKKKIIQTPQFDKEIAFSCISVSFSILLVEDSWT